MKINNEDIYKSEQIFINDAKFDLERLDFISDFSTFDLLAVPGSGKTTALLAKLYCLAQQLPLKNNAGILVLAHTNSAIEEIERQLKIHCPQLFVYPNFIGTVQSFANKFLTIPYYISKNKKKVSVIDNEMYNELFKSRLKYSRSKSINYILHKDPSKLYESYLKYNKESDKECDVINNGKLFNIEVPPKTWIKEDKVEEEIKKIRNFIVSTKISLFSEGYLNYNDCFFFSFTYLSKYPQIINIIQKRFKYVFIDEMQDLNQEQVDLIEMIFRTKSSESIIQRIGDKNQAIYSSNRGLEEESVWNQESNGSRIKVKTLNNSYRLTPILGRLVDGFVLKRDKGYKVEGIATHNEVPPYLIVYNNENDGLKLKNKFKELITKYNLYSSSQNKFNGYHIIAWTTEVKDKSNALHLKKLFPEFLKEKTQKKEHFNSLEKYLCFFDSDSLTFREVQESLLNGIIRVLRLYRVFENTLQKKYYTKETFIQFLKEPKNDGLDHYKAFKEVLYDWCINLIKHNNIEYVFNDYLSFITDYLSQNLKNFVVDDNDPFFKYTGNISNNKINASKNKEINSIDIKLSSIHKVKGQTHCATMYIETEFHNTESFKLTKKGCKTPLFFQKNEYKIQNRKRIDQTLKMMYVGFSRPTHLLCFAVQYDNIKNDIEKYKDAGWIVDSSIVEK
ncbi:UvrD-helicase domain-containing protein [Myroides profundi]|uniref:DNA 3'-5' helicase II n=1 Tax=Myroides profundi TaxID=480520 RepID=A0AAJ4W6L8_MYRPR|nr:UvrD-helicase domain-containing protein [Myroides profundi]AJH15579.1 DNA helicase II / ATP-dependent DNA helicase PcrA [Myroides profundi]SER52565.1 Superfamily I DNA or RNA helicase [Myroides profundi]